MSYSAAEIKKTIVAGVGFVLTVVVAVMTIGPDLIPNKWLPWIQVGIAVAGTYGVFAARNLGPAGQDPTVSVAEISPR